MFQKLSAIALLLAFGLVYPANKGNSYVSLTANTLWSFTLNGQINIIQIKPPETVGGKSCFMLEWHRGSAATPAMKTEFWFARSDSIFCAGIQGFGTKIVYPEPVLVIAERTSPNDTWLYVNGSGAFKDTVRCKAESFDSVYVGGKNILALKISRTGRGSAQYRWFAKGLGIVMEDNAGGTPSSTVQLKPSASGTSNESGKQQDQGNMIPATK
jgi:hypothetical protein